MSKSTAAVVTLLLLAPASAHALEIKNMRAVYGPFGAVRTDAKFLPGDALLLNYDILGLTIEPATGVARYTNTVEILDSAKKSIFKNTTPTQVVASLGGNQLPGEATIIMGSDQAPGKYEAKITVVDMASKDPKVATKEFSYLFDLLPKAFGFIHASAPVYGLVGQNTNFGVTLVGWDRDAKKLPNIDVTMKILDDAGKPTLTKPLAINVPKDIPEEEAKKEVLPIPLPVFFNRPGRFSVEMEATDQVSKKSAKLRFTINVLEANAGGK